MVTNEDAWLHQLDPRQVVTGEALRFWEMLRSEGLLNGMHRGPLADRPHLQAWSDAGIDMAARLADLLTRAGHMRWTGRSQRYQCDLGYGGAFYEVGTAAQIWGSQATVSLTTLAQARAQAAARPATPAAPPTAQDLTAMRAALRADFTAADSAWQDLRAR